MLTWAEANDKQWGLKFSVFLTEFAQGPASGLPSPLGP
jgi:hypothetical protein